MLQKFIKDHIFDSGDTKATGAPPVPGAPVAGQQTYVAPGGAAYTSAPMPSSFVDPQMVEDIRKVIARRGGAFSILQDKITILATSGLDTNMATRGAFAMLKAEGKTAEGVLSAIDLHIRDVEEEKKGFASAAQQQITKKAGTLRQESDGLLQANAADELTITSLEQQIQQLRQRMVDRAATASQKQMEAATAESDINGRVTKFSAAADVVIQTLAGQKMTLASLLS